MFPFRINFSLLGQSFEVGPYTLFFLLAIGVVVSGCFLFAVRRGFPAKKIAIVLAVMLVSAVIGARLMNLLMNFNAYAEDSAKLWVFSAQGFSEYGGIIFAVISGYVTCRILKLNPLKLGDTFIPFLGFGIAIMRIGCFCEGCCYGIVTNLPWGVKFPTLSPAHLHQIGTGGFFLDVQAVHPTQIYELVAALFFSWLALRILKKKYKKGMALFVFLAGFSLFRLFNYFLRVQPDTMTAPAWFYPALYVVILALCYTFIAINQGTETSQ